MPISRARVEAIPGFLRFYSLLGDTEIEPGSRTDVLYANQLIACSFARALPSAHAALVHAYLRENDASDYRALFDGSQPGWRIVEKGGVTRFERVVHGFRNVVHVSDPRESTALAGRMRAVGVPVEQVTRWFDQRELGEPEPGDRRAGPPFPKTWGGRLVHYEALPEPRSHPFGTDELWLAYCRCLHRSEDKGRTDSEELGVLSIGLTPPYPVRMFPMPAAFPHRPINSSGATRDLSLVAASHHGLLVTLTSPFSDERGWGKDNFLYELDRRASTWRQLALDGARFRSRPINANVAVEAPEWSLCGGEIAVYATDGELRLSVDGTPYHLDDWSPSIHALAALPIHDLLPKREGLDSLERNILAEEVDRELLEQVDPRVAGHHHHKHALHAELSPDGRVLVVFRLFVDDATLGALAVFERPLHSAPNKTAPT